SRMERKKYQLRFTEVPAAQIATETIEAFKKRFETSKFQFQVHIADTLPNIVADPEALISALVNLLENAYKYSNDDKRLAFRIYPNGEKVIFEVEDNGVGLSPRETKKIFQEFYQGAPSLSRRVGGCGL